MARRTSEIQIAAAGNRKNWEKGRVIVLGKRPTTVRLRNEAAVVQLGAGLRISRASLAYLRRLASSLFTPSVHFYSWCSTYRQLSAQLFRVATK